MKSKTSHSRELYRDLGLLQDPNKISKNSKSGKRRPAKTSEYVKKLEREANRPTKKKFKFGKEMCKELDYYIQKYADNYEAMARDKKNIYQDSPGQLRYKIKKYLKIHKPEQH